MKNKIFLSFIIILTLFLAISIVSASENTTDCISLNENSTVEVLQDNGSVSDNQSVSEISAPDKTSYVDYNDEFTVTLTSNGTALPNKQVSISLNNVNYNKTTDSNGKASINFKLKTGTYTINYSFAGDENYTSSNGTSTLTVKPDLITSLDVVDKYINYCEGIKSIFQIKLVDIYGNPISGKTVIVKAGGKTLTAKTNAKGIATFYLSLKKGTYDVQYYFNNDGKYVGSSGTFRIVVKNKLTVGNGYWVNKWSIKKVNLKKLSKLGTKHIFLLHTVFDKYGKNYVLKWIKKAHKYGMKVHIWMSVFYKNGKFIHPVSKKGVYNYNYINKMIKKAKYYASFSEVDGIHFDYVRFGGNAYKYKNAVNAVNYFIKQACISVRSVHPNIIVSAAVMPEPTSMKYYYAQDVPTMSKYLDVVIPMMYKGNYHASSKWIKKTTKKFVKQSKGAKIWVGLQTYKSDSNIKKLYYKALFKDAKAAKSGGAKGVVLFRWGLTKYLNFKKLKIKN
ncbi:MAG: Ig-like domain repeat protein [Methanobrevibacter sp.]|nr:Ig-like domain repeat protein [Methanobrevibacter sp.]